MSESDKLPPRTDSSFIDPGLGELGAATAKMMGAWTKAWQTVLTERAVPAMGLLNPSVWKNEGGVSAAETLETWLGTPQWSDLLSFDSETLKSFTPAVELIQVAQDYALATTRMSAEVCRVFQQRLASSDRKLDGAGEALELWNNIVDETMMTFNRSESFADLQRRFVRALMAYRLEQRRVVARLLEHYDIPTRDEVDEVTRRVHALERDNRALRRALAARADNLLTREQT